MVFIYSLDLQGLQNSGARIRASAPAPPWCLAYAESRSPSGGLLENPEDTTYYDWNLSDPKDSPFASFRFHYRSWTNLRQLNLVPPANSRGLKSASDSDSSTLKSALAGKKGLEGAGKPLAFGIESLDGTIFEDWSPNEVPKSSRRSLQISGIYALRSPPERLPPSMSTMRDARTAESKLVRDGLPDSYTHSSSLDVSETVTYSRKCSSESQAPSITPSLLPYVEDDSYHNEEVEYGVATTVELSCGSESEPKSVGRPLPRIPTQSSMSDYDASPPSSGRSGSPLRCSQQEYLITTGSLLERQLALFSSSQSQKANCKGDDDLSLDGIVTPWNGNLHQIGMLNMTESEWLKSSPSPEYPKPLKIDISKLQQPKAKFEKDLPGKQSTEGSNPPPSAPSEHDESTKQRRGLRQSGAREVMKPGENWI
jgi:hypothetical protein